MTIQAFQSIQVKYVIRMHLDWFALIYQILNTAKDWKLFPQRLYAHLFETNSVYHFQT